MRPPSPAGGPTHTSIVSYTLHWPLDWRRRLTQTFFKFTIPSTTCCTWRWTYCKLYTSKYLVYNTCGPRRCRCVMACAKGTVRTDLAGGGPVFCMDPNTFFLPRNATKVHGQPRSVPPGPTRSNRVKTRPHTALVSCARDLALVSISVSTILLFLSVLFPCISYMHAASGLLSWSMQLLAPAERSALYKVHTYSSST